MGGKCPKGCYRVAGGHWGSKMWTCGCSASAPASGTRSLGLKAATPQLSPGACVEV